jgi:protease-4
MIAFLRWARKIAVGTLNGLVGIALAVIILFGVLAIIGMMRGDGLPSNMVLTLDLRQPITDSAPESFSLGARPVTVMDIVLALDAAERDARVKGVWLRIGSANLPIAQAEEIGTALQRFRKSGKFVIAHSQGFLSTGLGDYLTASAADEIWMQPKSPFSPAGEGGGELFLRGLFDKVQAEPQIAKRVEYKSAADMYMEKNMTPADREQVTALMQSWYDAATVAAASDRNLSKQAIVSAFEASPQFADDVKKAGLVDHIGYDDDALAAALDKAGSGAKPVRMSEFVRSEEEVAGLASGPHIALIEASGEIVEGNGGGGGGIFDGGASAIGGDDLARAIRSATQDKDVRAIVLRVDSPGGSVTASDQILDAVKKAQAAGKPVVVSMGSVAASGGYYISTSANKIVAEPGTLTGSIGVLTGKVSIGKTLALAGVGTDEVGVGKNALMDSSITPFTPDQWDALNAEADAIYADFTQKVALGRKLPLAKVQEIARGRVWTGADASSRGLVDELGGFWTATAAAKKLAGIAADERVVFERYPKQKGLFDALDSIFGGSQASLRAIQGLTTLMNTPVMREAVSAAAEAPHGGVEMRATNLPR